MDRATQVLYEGRFIRLLSDNGWEYTQRVNCSGIAVVAAVTTDQKLLMVQQYRIPVGKDVLELPAGLIDDGAAASGESAFQAAQRELLEETGYVADRWEHVFCGPGGPGASSDVLNFYLALNARKVGQGGGDSTESIEVYAVPLGEVESWLHQRQTDGIPVDPKIYAGLYFLTKYNKVPT